MALKEIWKLFILKKQYPNINFIGTKAEKRKFGAHTDS
jgi:hypothetical protein